MLEAIALGLLVAAPSHSGMLEQACDPKKPASCEAAAVRYESGDAGVRDVARAAMMRARVETLPAPCPECRDTCSKPPTAKCEELCKAGSVLACSAIAHAALTGATGETLEQAVAMLEDCAAKHERAAAGTLGVLYLTGTSVKIDPAKGVKLLGESCALKYWPACDSLALAYEKGDAVPKDPHAAGGLYESACLAGLGQSCQRGGELYEQGVGLAVDKAHALKLYKAGCALGGEAGCAGVTRLKKRGQAALLKDGGV